MGTLDAESLFTNIPFDETIDICVNQIFENTDLTEGFTKSELKQLLCLTTKESSFILNGLLYKQIDPIDHLLKLPLLTNFCHTKKLVKQLSTKIEASFTDVMSKMFSYSSDRIFKIS